MSPPTTPGRILMEKYKQLISEMLTILRNLSLDHQTNSEGKLRCRDCGAWVSKFESEPHYPDCKLAVVIASAEEVLG